MAIEFRVNAKSAGLSAIRFLQGEIAAAPQAYLNQLFKKGKVLNSHGPLAADQILAVGESLLLPESARLNELISLSRQHPAPPVILYENSMLLIADKPAGLAVHSSVGHETLNLTALLQQQIELGEKKFRVSPVQRLDLETSGACLFGKGRKALGELGKLLMAHGLKKTYLGLASGSYAGPEELVSEVRAKGKIKEAGCLVKVLAANRAASLLQIELQSGRQHQIRQQLAQQGCPLFGDRRYHGPCPPELPRVFLHSYQLAFHSPFGGEPIEVVAPLPAELSAFLLKVGLRFRL
jgi:23S rRNA-/tRNA-specific pseudouridylate synthase